MYTTYNMYVEMAVYLDMKRSRSAVGVVALLWASALGAHRAPPAAASNHRSPARASANGPLLIEDNGPSRVGGPLLYTVTPGQPRHAIGPALYGEASGKVGAVAPGDAYLAAGAASPRGRSIALAEQEGGLWVLDVTGAAPRRVVGAAPPPHEGIDVAAVAWSPDGVTLAYVRDGRNLGDSCGPATPDTTPGDGLWVVPSDGRATPRQILTAASLGTDGINDLTVTGLTGWTPDGQAVIANTARGVEAIAIPSGRRRLLAAGAYGALSPDGTRLALVYSTLRLRCGRSPLVARWRAPGLHRATGRHPEPILPVPPSSARRADALTLDRAGPDDLSPAA